MSELVTVSLETQNRWWGMSISELEAEREFIHNHLEEEDLDERDRRALCEVTLAILIIMRKKGFKEKGLHF